MLFEELSDAAAHDPEVIDAQAHLDRLLASRDVFNAIDTMLASPRIQRPALYPSLYRELDEAYSQKVGKSTLGLRLAQGASIIAGAGIIVAGLCSALTLGNLTLSVLSMTALPLLFLPAVNRSLSEKRKESLLRKDTAQAKERVNQALPDAKKQLSDAKVRAQVRVAARGEQKELQDERQLDLNDDEEFLVIGEVRLRKNILQ